MEKKKYLVPKQCSVCSRMSFMRCIDCDIVFCSEMCQIKDWENHIVSHLKKSKSSVGKMDRSERSLTSVNTRLIKHRLIENPDELAEEDTAQPREEELADRKENLSANTDHETKMQAKNREIILSRKFKRHVKIWDETMDSEGYFYALVTNIGSSKDISHIYSIIPRDYMKLLECYVEELQEFYESEDSSAVMLQDVISKKNLLYMVKIDGKWTRCIVLEYKAQTKRICLEDIDSGKKYEAEHSTFLFKAAHDSDMAKSAYSLKVHFVNSSNRDTIKVGDVIKIKISVASVYSSVVSPAEFYIDAAENQPLMQAEKADGENRFSINQILLREFKTGRNMKVMFLDGQNLSKGLLHVCEGTEENLSFYSKLIEEINQYAEATPEANNYKPIVNELILTKFNDGNVYRAMCISAGEFDCKVYFLDYGNEMNARYQDIWRMPEQFVKNCVSRTVCVNLRSGRPIQDIDVEETKDKLAYADTFEADISVVGEKKYSITIDDSLVVFKH